jgi:cytochrome c biogenesis protein CcdA/thioredoxin-related protein
MRPIRLLLSVTAFVTSSFLVTAQEKAPVSLHYSKQRIDDSTVVLTIQVDMGSSAKLYALPVTGAEVLYSELVFDSLAVPHLAGPLSVQGTVHTERDPDLDAEVGFHKDSVIWLQRVRVGLGDSLVVRGSIRYMCKVGQSFVNGEEAFRFSILPEAGAGGTPVADRSLWWVFLAAFAGGLLALLTPCVYSMIPVTVSFFTKRSTTRSEGIRNAVYYAVSIVVIFTLLGFLVTVVFGPAALNNLATNWIANLLFFVLFLVFGISFLGAFEINLPSSWMNRSDARAGATSFGGIFFMALTLVLVSFSCTGPIIGNLLVLAARGSYLGPLVGMFGFSLALALPFALFAFFPSKLNILGRAGGWLNAVKVTLGFLELALALKFLSNADLVKGWRLLDREVFLSLWIVIFLMLGIYLLGKLRFHHDDELPKNDFGLPYLSVTRLFFAIASLSFAVYMVPGMWGAPLKAIGAFLPPVGTQDFILSDASAGQGSPLASKEGDGQLPHPVKYYERMRVYEPEVVRKYGMTTYFDYEEALSVARRLKKPLMLDFTGINCVNCRKMEAEVWSDPEVMRRLKEDFVIVSLYVDVQDIELPEAEHYRSEALGKTVITLGDKNADMQVTRFQANSQPYYFFLDNEEKRLVPDGYGYDPNIAKFIRLLEEAKAKFGQ